MTFKSVICVAGILAFGFVVSLSKTSHAAQTEIEIAAKRTKYQGDVYLLRGFAGVFSRGLDNIGSKLKGRGVKAKVIAENIFPNNSVHGTVFGKSDEAIEVIFRSILLTINLFQLRI